MRPLLHASVVVAVLGLAACDLLRPRDPTLTPRSAEVTSATSSGLGLRIHLVARNPNRIDLTVQRLDVRITVAGRDLGPASIPQATTLASERDVPLTADVTAPWQDLPGLVMATVQNENVPYHLEGTVTVGGARVNLTVPFRMDSTIPRQVLVNAASASVPSVPGLPQMPGF